MMSTRSRSPVENGRPESPILSDHRNAPRSPPRQRSMSPGRSRSPPPRHDSRYERPTLTQPTGQPSNVLGVFGLSTSTKERDIQDLFSPFGPITSVNLVYDSRSQMSRGFAFIYFESQPDAERALQKCNGILLDGRNIRVDFSRTRSAHDPTPGKYMGIRRDVGRRFPDSERRDQGRYYGGGPRYYEERRSGYDRRDDHRRPPPPPPMRNDKGDYYTSRRDYGQEEPSSRDYHPRSAMDSAYPPRDSYRSENPSYPSRDNVGRREEAPAGGYYEDRKSRYEERRGPVSPPPRYRSRSPIMPRDR